MSLLLEEIRRKKQEAMEIVDKEHKMFRRKDLEKQMEEKYYKLLHGNGKANDDDEHSNGTLDSNHDELQDQDLPDISMAEVRRRLRGMAQPILLFGEDEIDVRRRLRDCEIQNMDVIRERQRNDLQDALQNVDASAVNDILRGSAAKQEDHGPKYTWEDMQLSGKKLGKQDDAADMRVIRRFFKFLLDLWGQDLDERPIEIKQSPQGKRASAIYVQTAENLKPLFKGLKRKDLSLDIVNYLREIALCVLKREYIAANDAYLRMSIGNAPWPIGVTNVGIHNRTGREKIYSQNIAHVLNDEMQRKYIQGLKRLMTFCQKRYPNVPSKCLEFQGLESELYPVNNDLKMRELEAEQAAWIQAGHTLELTANTLSSSTE
eukprot:m.72564 g.72564  ORF g.72564 m.72564 type:complete len:375 (-) comp13862_c0_seq8:1798-2922(-)